MVASGATVVGTGLASFGVIGKMGGVVGGRVGLSVDREKDGEWDESKETKRERRGEHGGQGRGRRATCSRKEDALKGARANYNHTS